MLKDITNQLLSDEETPLKLREATIKFHSLLLNLTGIIDDSIVCDDTTTQTLLTHGEAISPRDAARCVLDYQRAIKFLRGTYAAILEAQKRFPNQRINILYAGCGPFATLVLPLCTRFKEGEVSLTLLDAHDFSLNAAQKVFREFGLSNFVRDYIQCDASRYKTGIQPHIVIIETMQSALKKEPQIAITLNLAPQLCDGGLFIPKKIEINACLSKIKDEFSFDSADRGVVYKRNRISLGRIFEISAENANELRNSIQTDLQGVISFPPSVVEIPDGVNDGYNVMIRTKVHVFDEFILDDYDSGITYPKTLYDLGNPKSKTRIEFRYCLTNPVGFRYRIV